TDASGPSVTRGSRGAGKLGSAVGLRRPTSRGAGFVVTALEDETTGQSPTASPAAYRGTVRRGRSACEQLLVRPGTNRSLALLAASRLRDRCAGHGGYRRALSSVARAYDTGGSTPRGSDRTGWDNASGASFSRVV